MRDLKELRWRSKGPALPTTVLNAATLRTGTELPATYRTFLSQMDGGKPGRGAFTSAGQTWVLEAFYSFADAAHHREKLNKSGRLVPGYLPVAFAEAFDKPLVFLELSGDGAVYIKPSARTRWDEAGAVTRVADSFAGFLDLLGDAPAIPVAPPAPVVVEVVGGNGTAPSAPAAEEPAPAPAPNAGKSAAEKRAVVAAKPAAPKPAAPKPAAPKPAAPTKAAAPKPVAKAKPAKKAPAKKAKAAKARPVAKKKPAAKKKASKPAGRPVAKKKAAGKKKKR